MTTAEPTTRALVFAAHKLAGNGLPLDRTLPLGDQVAHLLRMARKAKTRGWAMVARELLDEAQRLCEQYVNTDDLCGDGHPLSEDGRCPTCDERFEQLIADRRAAAASAEARIDGCPF